MNFGWASRELVSFRQSERSLNNRSGESTYVHECECNRPRYEQTNGHPGYNAKSISCKDALVQECDTEFGKADGRIPNHSNRVVDHGEVGGPISCDWESVLVEFCVAPQVANSSICARTVLAMFLLG
jgi:hypothetical protein